MGGGGFGYNVVESRNYGTESEPLAIRGDRARLALRAADLGKIRDQMHGATELRQQSQAIFA